ncbi:MAG: ComEA family DNA-binding protein, partial [Chitinophagales bacterium]
MRRLKKITREYFTFSRKERNVGIYLASLILMVIIFPSVHRIFFIARTEINYDSLKNLLVMIPVENDMNANELFMGYEENRNDYQKYNKYPKSPFYKDEYDATTNVELFSFDPNLISMEEWIKLGIRENVASRIINYIAKGGKFKTKNDLLKTYGFQQKDFDRIKDYIVIDTSAFKYNQENLNSNISEAGEKKLTDINSATIEQLRALGFDVAVAERIIKLRDGTGGLISADQLAEVYNMDADLLAEIRPFIKFDASLVTKININTVSFDVLAKHTYISDALAQSIIDYRQKTGKFYTISELMKVKGMYPTLFEKLKPYIT